MSRVVLITGAAQGIGRALAASFAALGDQVVMTDRSPAVHAAAEEVRATGSRPVAMEFDVSSEEQFEHAVSDVAERFGGLDVLINNAAITSTKSIWEVNIDEWDAVMAVNLRGTFIGSRAAARHMRQRGAEGRIVNIASIAGQTGGVAAGPHYAASKAGILLLTKAFARELASDRITVNAIAAAAIEGPNLQSLVQADRDRIVKTIPIGRFSKDSDVTSAAIYLSSKEASFVTGSTLDVNGGLLLR